ncbi:unnamed protein product [Lasius platythorax]|uniref:Uncharacterized protein n=1 Tax=Lasius platythorax TaxID=488582 RepID=A0AAV2P0X0_9HYME
MGITARKEGEHRNLFEELRLRRAGHLSDLSSDLTEGTVLYRTVREERRCVSMERRKEPRKESGRKEIEKARGDRMETGERSERKRDERIGGRIYAAVGAL